MVKIGLVLLMLSILLVALPLLGAGLADHPLDDYLEFPPVTRYVQHAEFSWAVFACLSITAMLLVLAMVRLYMPLGRAAYRVVNVQSMPCWGWGALASLLVCWTLAWTRLDWPGAIHSFTFAPLWVSYVMLVNAFTYRRTGTCLLLHHPLYLLALFPASALFWWYFEYLNRFVQNWYYSGIDEFTALRYSIQATVAFSTVLPAVVSTMELMKSFPILRPKVRPVTVIEGKRKLFAGLLLLLACFSLIAVPIWPDYLFPLVWLVPAVILECLLLLADMETVWSRLRDGDWHPAILSMLAALVCGVLWEMWNYHSMPKWLYSIPFVGRFKVFEMPLLGYLGYLPFGLECLVVAEQLKKVDPTLWNPEHVGPGLVKSRHRKAGLPGD